MTENIKITPKISIIKIEQGINKGKIVKIKKDLGSLTIMSQDEPIVKTWDIGQEYKLELVVKQTGANELDKWDIENGKGMPEDIRATFEIIEINIPSNSSK